MPGRPGSIAWCEEPCVNTTMTRPVSVRRWPVPVVVVVLAAGGASLVKVVQRIGRGVRAKDTETGNYIPIWFPLDELTEFSREHTITRVSYLERAEISIEENTGDWPRFFRFLREKYGKNLTRVA